MVSKEYTLAAIPSFFILTIIQIQIWKQTFKTQTFENKHIECYKSVKREKIEKVYVRGIIAIRDLRSYFTRENKKKKNFRTGIPDLVKTSGNVTASDAFNVNTESESLRKKRETGLAT